MWTRRGASLVSERASSVLCGHSSRKSVALRPRKQAMLLCDGKDLKMNRISSLQRQVKTNVLPCGYSAPVTAVANFMSWTDSFTEWIFPRLAVLHFYLWKGLVMDNFCILKIPICVNTTLLNRGTLLKPIRRRITEKSLLRFSMTFIFIDIEAFRSATIRLKNRQRTAKRIGKKSQKSKFFGFNSKELSFENILISTKSGSYAS